MAVLQGYSNRLERSLPQGGGASWQPDLTLPGQGLRPMRGDFTRVSQVARNSVPGAPALSMGQPAPARAVMPATTASVAPASPWATGLESLVVAARAAVATWTAGWLPRTVPLPREGVPAPVAAPVRLAPASPGRTVVPVSAPVVSALASAPAPVPALSGQRQAARAASPPAWAPGPQPPLHDPAYQAALEALRQLQELHHRLPVAEPTWAAPRPPLPPASVPLPPVRPAPPVPPPPPPPVRPTLPPALAAPGLPAGDAAARLKGMPAAELAELGRTDKRAFLAALRPAAEDSERRYGVPAAVTLAQAALETGWGKAIIPGFNLFGIKGKGPAGTISRGTWEVYNGRRVDITANFARYHDFYEAVMLHGKLFHNGYYDRAMSQYQRDRDPHAFARNITGTYATDPSYGRKLSEIMRTYGLA